ncbi:TPA: hypothetical protein ACXK4S_000660 [Pseudomonas aeruginosa]
MNVRNLFAVFILMILFSANAFAAADGMTGLGGVGQRVGLVSIQFKTVAIILAGFLGVALMIAGGLQLKKYADNPQQNPISKPMIYLISGIIIFGISATSETMMHTIFGEEATEEARLGGFSREFLDAGTTSLLN